MAKKEEAKAQEVSIVQDMEASNPYAGVFSVGKNVEGVDLKLPHVDIIHKAQMFLMPDGSKVEQIEALILDWTNQNAWWEKTLNDGGEGGTLPDCYSTDGIHPEAPEGKTTQAKTCSACPKNKFGSDRKGGKGKDCANKRLLHILVRGSALPYRMRLPASCLRECDNYMTFLLDKRIPYPAAATVIKLEKLNAGTPTESSVVKFSLLNAIELEQAKKVKALMDKFSTAFRHKAIEAVVEGAPPSTEKQADKILSEAGIA